MKENPVTEISDVYVRVSFYKDWITNRVSGVFKKNEGTRSSRRNRPAISKPEVVNQKVRRLILN